MQAAEVILSSARCAGANVVINLLFNQDLDGATALHAAVESGSVETTSFLLKTWKEEERSLQMRYDELLRTLQYYVKCILCYIASRSCLKEEVLCVSLFLY